MSTLDDASSISNIAIFIAYSQMQTVANILLLFQDGNKGLLDNVALLDSMESTLGTKPADSREGKGDEGMKTIPETGREYQTETARTRTETARYSAITRALARKKPILPF